MYAIHPIAECYPPLSVREFAALKEHIKANGLQNAIILFEGKVLDGKHRQLGCAETGVEPRYTTPEIADPYAYVVGANERRRQLSEAARAVVGERLATLKLGTNRHGKKLDVSAETSRNPGSHATMSAIAGMLNIGRSSIEKVRYVKTHGIPEIMEAIESNKIAVEKARQLVHLPKGEQATGLVEALKKPKRKHTKTQQLPTTIVAKKQQSELDTFLHTPSIYPLDAHIPTGNSSDEKRLREAIDALRANEDRIPEFGVKRLNELIYPYTQFVQAYYHNRFNHPRPEGQLDRRIFDWVLNVAEKMVRHRKVKMFDGPQREKPDTVIRGFDGFWDAYWREEAKLLRHFPHDSFAQIKERWLIKAEEIFRQKHINAQRLQQDRKNKVSAST